MKPVNLFSCFALMIALVSCGGAEKAAAVPYPHEVENNFVVACAAKNNGRGDLCVCTIKKIEQQYSLQEFSRIEVQIETNGAPLPTQMLNDFADCRVGILP